MTGPTYRISKVSGTGVLLVLKSVHPVGLTRRRSARRRIMESFFSPPYGRAYSEQANVVFPAQLSRQFQLFNFGDR